MLFVSSADVWNLRYVAWFYCSIHLIAGCIISLQHIFCMSTVLFIAAINLFLFLQNFKLFFAFSRRILQVSYKLQVTSYSYKIRVHYNDFFFYRSPCPKAKERNS